MERISVIWILLCCVLATSATTARAGYSEDVLSDDPVAYWRLDEASGTLATDLSGNGNHGTFSGPVLGVPGADCGTPDLAATFLNIDDRMTAPTSRSLELPFVTMEAWVLWCGDNGWQQRVMEKSWGGVSISEYGLTVLSTGEVRVEIRGTSSVMFTSTGTLTPNQWTHLAATYDGAQVAVYIGGVLDSSAPAAVGPISNSNKPIGIGNQAQRDRPWNGSLADVAVYDYALSFVRIREHAANCNPPATVACPLLPLEKIYWTDYGSDKIQRCDRADGSNVVDIVTAGLDGPQGIAINSTDGTMYWTDFGTDSIRRANVDGTGIVDLVTTGLTIPDPIALDLDGGRMYWCDRGSDKIQTSLLDGTDVQDLVTTGLSSVGGLALDLFNGHMYWADGGTTDRIQRSKIDGFSIETIFTDTFNPHGIALDVPAGKMYWSESGMVRRANMDGTGPEDLVTGLGQPRNLALYAGKVYWADSQTGKIQRADMTGGPAEDLVTGLVSPYGIALGTGEAFVSDVADESPLFPGGSLLEPASPNPFRQSTELAFELARDQSVRLEVFDTGGRLVQTLAPDRLLAAGRHSVSWDGRNQQEQPVSAGVYFFRMTTEDETESRSIVLLR